MYEQAQTQSEPTQGQFSPWTFKTVATFFGVLLVLMTCPPAVAALYVGLTGMLAIATWVGRGWIRAFAVGALFPHLAGYFLLLEVRRPSDLLGMALASAVVSCASGIAAATFHGALSRRNGILPIPNLPFLRDWLTNE